MARKFSLKDNPIFQRLEVPKPRETRSQLDATGSSAEVDIDEGQKETRKIRPAKLDPQILTRKEKEQETNSSEEATPQRQSDFDPTCKPCSTERPLARTASRRSSGSTVAAAVR